MISLQERVHAAPPPEGWRLDKLHRVLSVRKGMKNTGMQEDNLLSLSYGRIVRKDIGSAEGLLPESFETYQIVDPGNIVMRLTDLQNDKRSIRQGLVTERGIITSAYDALEVRKGHEPRYWAYALLALDLAKYYYSLGAGVRQSIKFADFPNDWIGTPSLEAQRSIADFLDRETARIDGLIQKKQRLIELLDEREINNLIHTFSVLSSEMVAWKVSHVCTLKRGRFNHRPRNAPELYDGQYPFLQTGDVAQARKYINNYKQTLSDLGASVSARFPKGTILMAIAANVGDVAISEFDAYCPDSLVGFVPSRQLDREFLYYALKALRPSIATSSTSNAQDNTNVARLGALKIPLPEMAMQKRIVEGLDNAEQRNRALVEATSRSITYLREFRASLITVAVTGQVDLALLGRRAEIDGRLKQLAGETS
ncbi:restriction endonuclease subunit S [Agrobacterium tumefaciens]|nr:restriction endonuclease subunit S [Agrobacterium tumefaciens]